MSLLGFCQILVTQIMHFLHPNKGVFLVAPTTLQLQTSGKMKHNSQMEKWKKKITSLQVNPKP